MFKFIICPLLGKSPADRVKTLLGKLDSMRRNKERGYNVSEEIRHTSHKFMGRIEKIFKTLPKPLEWRSFYNNDLPLLVDFCEEVQEISIQHRPWPRPLAQTRLPDGGLALQKNGGQARALGLEGKTDQKKIWC